KIMFTTGHHDPKRPFVTKFLFNLIGPVLFLVRQVDIALKRGDWHFYTQLRFKVLMVAVNKVQRPLVALIDQRIMHLDGTDAGVALFKFRDMRIMLPEFRRRGLYRCGITIGMGQMQVSYGSREHYNIAWTKVGS